MKFSYSLIKKFIPQLKNKKQLVEALNSYSFEAVEKKGDVVEVDIWPNRYSEASHFSLSREVAAILNFSLKTPFSSPLKTDLFSKTQNAKFKVEIEDEFLCPRYGAQYFENIKVEASPPWLQKILKTCGLRPINNIVDIVNYVMLEIGQPLHAFDFDKIKNVKGNNLADFAKIIVRRAKKGEKILTLDNQLITLDKNILVIADQKEPIAIAGIKGGKKAEVTKKTKRIILESANFEPTIIYQASKFLNLSTDASLRFSHGLSPVLVDWGISRCATLFEKIANAKKGPRFDSLKKPLPPKILKFDLFQFNRFIGIELTQKEAEKFLKRLGFKRLKDNLWEVPPWRLDIENDKDLFEEVIRLFGYKKIKNQPPLIYLKPSGFEEIIERREKIKKILVGLGLSEVYNYSFISENDLKLNPFWQKETQEVLNPPSSQFKYLRPSLAIGILKNIKENHRFFEEVKIFEIGKIFSKTSKGLEEKNALAIAISKPADSLEPFFELKGIVQELFDHLGFSDYLILEAEDIDWPKKFAISYLKPQTILKIKSGNEIIGYLGQVKNPAFKKQAAFAELIFDKLPLEGENIYEPLPRYPAVVRDLSFFTDYSFKIGEIMQSIKNVNPSLIEDIDFIDEFEIKNNLESQKRRSLTFRIVFRSPYRTLLKEEVDEEMKKIISMLGKKFKAEMR